MALGRHTKRGLVTEETCSLLLLSVKDAKYMRLPDGFLYHRIAQLSLQMKDKVTEEDNALIDRVLESANNLERINSVALQKVNPTPQDTLGDRLFGDICNVFVDAINQTVQTLEEKICL